MAGRRAGWPEGYQYYIAGEYEEALLKFKESARKILILRKRNLFNAYLLSFKSDGRISGRREKIGGIQA